MVDEIDDCKSETGKHPRNSAAGAEQVHYWEIREMDSTLLTKVINESIARGDCPTTWILAILIAIIKKPKPGDDPNSYRTVGLESCILKFVTLLMMRRFVAWADSRKLIPPSQNGFRKGFRTNNNASILRRAIEKVKSIGKTLWIASIDITNAFPSVDCSTL